MKKIILFIALIGSMPMALGMYGRGSSRIPQGAYIPHGVGSHTSDDFRDDGNTQYPRSSDFGYPSNQGSINVSSGRPNMLARVFGVLCCWVGPCVESKSRHSHRD